MASHGDGPVIEEVGEGENGEEEAVAGSCSDEDDALKGIPDPEPAAPVIVDAADLETALEVKARGNTHFKGKEWESAIECYTHAIDLVPSGAPEVRATRPAAPSPLSLLRSVRAPSQCASFFANRAACYAKLGQHANVVDDCTAALVEQPDYTKAWLRRALAREALDQPAEAHEDAKRAVELEPSDKEAAVVAKRLERKAEAKVEEQKEEMLGKLKDLGNSFLGNFGLSTDNFKMDKDPNTGSYNISFQQ